MGSRIVRLLFLKCQGNQGLSIVRLLFLQNERVLTFVFSLFVLFQKFLLQQKQVDPDPVLTLLRTRRNRDGLHFFTQSLLAYATFIKQ